jgi:hypothetical protein
MNAGTWSGAVSGGRWTPMKYGDPCTMTLPRALRRRSITRPWMSSADLETHHIMSPAVGPNPAVVYVPLTWTRSVHFSKSRSASSANTSAEGGSPMSEPCDPKTG